jgi:hypothetical protein
MTMAEPLGAAEHLTESQKTWMASLRANLEKETGRALEDWVDIARTCPETAHRARLTWMKTHHGLGQNRASVIFAQAFPAAEGEDTAQARRAALWSDPNGLAILEAVEGGLVGLESLVIGQRKTYSAWSRKFQFAAMRPLKGGRVRLGLAVPPDAGPGLEPADREGWSERLKASITLSSPSQVDADLLKLLQAAWDGS